jgi:hypothetical protein
MEEVVEEADMELMVVEADVIAASWRRSTRSSWRPTPCSSSRRWWRHKGEDEEVL